MIEIKKIEKRDGKITEFNPKKIIDAIYKATEAVGMPNFQLAKTLTDRVVKRLEENFNKKEIPKVEQIQDAVEQVLMEERESRIAKAYILYRQKRSTIRTEKQQILNKNNIDGVDKKFDINSLRVLRSRYLKKDKEGKVKESPKELFRRVAVHVALPSLLYNTKVFQKEKAPLHAQESFNIEEHANKINIGKFKLNQFHLSALKRLFDRFNEKKQIKITWSRFFNLIKKGEFDHYEQEIEQYYNLMVERRFFPNTPALVNFGNYLGMGSACFVLGVEDSIDSIMDTLKRASLIFKAGGGVGYNFSHIRPEGDFVKTTGGVASGPISFMSLFNRMTEVIKQGGIRRGANIGILNCSHPDIYKFITAKKENLALHNFNISVFIDSDFWDYYRKNKPYPLVNPRTNEAVKNVNPRKLFDLLVYQGWESAEPGIIFGDWSNKYNPFLDTLGPIEATNPCGEVLLYPYESCNLGSINVWSFVKREPTNGRKKHVEFDWKAFEKAIHLATRFLDNVVEINNYPLKKIEETSLSTRKIGLGIMGLGNLLYDLEIPYDSNQGVEFMERIMEFVNFHSKNSSVDLARERGVFPYYDKSFYSKGKLPFKGSEEEDSWHLDWDNLKKRIKKHGLRNAFTTVIAPTGSISMIAGCSSGIEPVYSLVFEKKVAVGTFYYVDPVFEKVMSREGIFDEDLIREVSRRAGSIEDLRFIPYDLRKIFCVSMDIKAEDHIKALAAFQKWTDSSISKTINFPEDVSIDEMKKAYLLAHKLGCKDLTVFRNKSISGVLTAGATEKKKKEQRPQKLISYKDNKAMGHYVYQEANVSEDEQE